MKKRIISITILVISLFIITNVKAEELYDAAGVNSNYNKYINSVKEYEASSCNDVLYTQTIVDKCNSFELERTRALAYMFNAKEYDESLINSEVQKILDANSENCRSFASSSIQELINKLYLMFYIAGPILLILFGTMDITSAIVASDEKKRKALYTRFIRRLIALALLFLAPVLVNIIINMFGANKYSSSKYTCTFTPKKVTLKYTSRRVKKSKKKGSKNGGKGNSTIASAIVEYAAAVTEVGQRNGWTYGCVGASAIISAYENDSYTNPCCADYVSAVLVLAGAFSEDEINNMGSFNEEHCGNSRGNTYATGVHMFLLENDWIFIDDPSELQPGDIIVSNAQVDTNPSCIAESGELRAGHVEIYAGDNQAYSAGDNTPGAIIPKLGGRSYSKCDSESCWIGAFRAP